MEFTQKLLHELTDLTKEQALTLAGYLDKETGDQFICWWHSKQPDEESEYFTVYFTDGTKNILRARTIPDAVTKALKINCKENLVELAWCDKSITDTHYYDSTKQKWVRYETLVLNIKDNLPVTSLSDLEEKLDKHKSIKVILSRKDELLITKTWGHFIFGWTNYIEVVYGAYQQGSYDGSDPDDHHFIACASEYFPIEDTKHASEAFLKRLLHNPHMVSGLASKSLEEINVQQQPI